MIQFFNTILYQPLLNLLVFFYNVIPGHDLGVAIITLTVILKLILFPLSRQSLKSQKALQSLQPKMEEIKKKYPDQKEKQAKMTMELYKENKINPFSSCLPLLIQLPILIAVYQVFNTGLTSTNLPVYSFIYNPGHLNSFAFGFLNLAKPNIL
ncbi:MAG: YidC/Oxa1 family membrane protein insertase [Patescibacteria group bacterium]|nr:YidC/Oxa1 family membrane protein insertase [Patescibacteria group bacterium]